MSKSHFSILILILCFRKVRLRVPQGTRACALMEWSGSSAEPGPQDVTRYRIRVMVDGLGPQVPAQLGALALFLSSKKTNKQKPTQRMLTNYPRVSDDEPVQSADVLLWFQIIIY